MSSGHASSASHFAQRCLARQRLARLKSSLNLKLVRRYKDKKGQTKIQGGPHLTQSGVYPIGLGLKAGGVVGRGEGYNSSDYGAKSSMNAATGQLPL